MMEYIEFATAIENLETGHDPELRQEEVMELLDFARDNHIPLPNVAIAYINEKLTSVTARPGWSIRAERYGDGVRWVARRIDQTSSLDVENVE
jgi:hypothetical protein